MVIILQHRKFAYEFDGLLSETGLVEAVSGTKLQSSVGTE